MLNLRRSVLMVDNMQILNDNNIFKHQHQYTMERTIQYNTMSLILGAVIHRKQRDRDAVVYQLFANDMTDIKHSKLTFSKPCHVVLLFCSVSCDRFAGSYHLPRSRHWW